MKKYENFLRTLNNLQEIYNYNEPYGTVELAGLVGLYEQCFEQAWKAMKEILEDNGFDESRTGSPRGILKTAYGAGMIDNEALWLAALSDRNDVAHAYKEEIALSIVKNTKEQYYDMFLTLRNTIDDKWLF